MFIFKVYIIILFTVTNKNNLKLNAKYKRKIYDKDLIISYMKHCQSITETALVIY